MPVETLSYGGWADCLRLTDGRLEAVATTRVGPRILRFGLAGGENLLHEVPAHRGLTGGEAWRSYGGHRLWHAPEARPRTYHPDNEPVTVEIDGDQVRFLQPVEPHTGIQKTLALRFHQGRLELRHRLENRGAWPVELAPWAITMMAPGGMAFVPRAPFGPHPDLSEGEGGVPSYLPAQSLVLWSYTRLQDARWAFREGMIGLRQDPGCPAPLKFGLDNRQGWCAYLNRGVLFLKRFPWREGAVYPDRGCSTEVFVNAEMLELESLGPLVRLDPGEGTEHAESWQVWKHDPGDAWEGVARAVRESDN